MEISSLNLVNFDYGVRRCHAATCINPSLMHLFLSLLCVEFYRKANVGNNGEIQVYVVACYSNRRPVVPWNCSNNHLL